MKNFWKVTLFTFATFFLSWVVVYKTGINTLPIQSEDTVPTMFIPYAVLKDKTLYLDNYYKQMVRKYPHPDDKGYTKGMTPFYLKRVDIESELLTNLKSSFVRTRKVEEVRYVSAFPMIAGFLSIPVYAIPIALGVPPSWDNLILLSHISSSLIMAFSTGLFYLLLSRHFLKDEKKTILLTALYAFGTVNFAMLSQSLWQHGTVQLFSILGLLFLLESIKEKKEIFYYLAGFSLGFAILSRPTAALVAGLLALLILFDWIKPKKKNLVSLLQRFSYYVLGFIPPILFFILYNNVYYKDLANQGYASQLLVGWLGRFPEGFLGMWLSPSKGILVYSPVLVFSFVGLWYYYNKTKKTRGHEYLIYGLIVLVHTLVLSKWKHWYGGYSFGYRMASDVIPFMLLLIVPYIESKLFDRTKKIFFGLLVVSVLVQLFGLVFFDGIWHNAYDLGYDDTSWLWSIKDSEFMFNVRRVLVKVGVLNKACPQCLPG